RFPDAKALAAELLRRGWLTAYQVNLLLEGRGPGLALGPYALLEPLGEGGMGAVFKARNRKLGRVVALKVIHPECLAHADSVRRDVKPHNLLLTPGGVVKVLDLGLARWQRPDRGESSSTLTQEGTVLGTLDYIAPEQALDSRSVDARADLYGLGGTLYFLLTG